MMSTAPLGGTATEVTPTLHGTRALSDTERLAQHASIQTPPAHHHDVMRAVKVLASGGQRSVDAFLQLGALLLRVVC